MDYMCKECISLCCANDYTMPVFKFEVEIYRDHYPQVAPLIIENKHSNTDELLRSNKCFFLSDSGLCSIQKDLTYKKKPLVCQVYPLIFVKYPNYLFVYQYPCKGMKWHMMASENRKNNIISIAEQIDQYYKKIFSDQVDGYNPFMYIDESRLVQSLDEINYLTYHNWNYEALLRKQFRQEKKKHLINIKKFVLNHTEKNEKFLPKEWVIFERSVVHWLFFNPFFLALEIEQAVILIGLAITWMKDILLTQFSLNAVSEKNKETINDVLNRVCWAGIEIVHQDWWTKLVSHYIPRVFSGWEEIKGHINFLLENNYLPFPDD